MFFKSIKKILRHIKERNSRMRQLKDINEILKAKVKCSEHDVVQSYLNGHSNTWTMVQVCLYDMYKNMELLDYGSLITTMAKRLESYDVNNTLREEKLKQFDEDSVYRKQLTGDEDVNDTNDNSNS